MLYRGREKTRFQIFSNPTYMTRWSAFSDWLIFIYYEIYFHLFRNLLFLSFGAETEFGCALKILYKDHEPACTRSIYIHFDTKLSHTYATLLCNYAIGTGLATCHVFCVQDMTSLCEHYVIGPEVPREYRKLLCQRQAIWKPLEVSQSYVMISEVPDWPR